MSRARSEDEAGPHAQHTVVGQPSGERPPRTANIEGYASAATGRSLGLLDNFERGLERAVNGAFAKTFRSGLQPVEITSALKRELDTKAVVVARDRILVPNKFVIRLNPNDYDNITGLGPAVIDEFVAQVERHATIQHYSFAGGISIELESQDGLAQGVIDIDSVNVKGSVAWTPVLDIDGKRHPITSARTIIGRGSDADITVDDTGISRKHVEILWDGKRGQVNDLGSTNGSKLNGMPLRKAPLEPDSVIEIGRTRIVFHVLAQSSDETPRSTRGRAG
jgi:hypothetical protein